jgi:hypothetical protein
MTDLLWYTFYIYTKAFAFTEIPARKLNLIKILNHLKTS